MRFPPGKPMSPLSLRPGRSSPGWAALVLMGLFFSPVLEAARGAERHGERPPNIVFILADDLGYGDLGCLGQEIVRTPRLDRMADEGMILTDFYAGSTVCAPSRSVFITGQHTGRTRIRGNRSASGERVPLRPEDPNVARMLYEAGYSTGAVGKWGLGEAGSPGIPNRQGFGYWFGFLNQGRAHTYYPDWIWRNEVRYDLTGNWDGARGLYVHDLFTAEALAFIRAHRDQPFFLYLPYTIPHAEIAAPEDSLEEYAGRFEETYFPGRGNYAAQEQPRAAFAAMVTRMDRDVGALLDLLDELDLAGNTLVLFSSDNGAHREGGADPEFFGSSGPLRGIKRDLYEGGIRVPTLAWWPGRIAPGTVSDHVADFADFLPTAAELAGLEPPAGIDGVSFLPALLGEPERQQQRPYLYWEFYEQGSSQAVRRGDWKAVRRPAFSGPIELYDLATDLGEAQDVAAEHPEVVAEMERIMAEAHEPDPLWQPAGRTPAPPPPGSGELPEVLRQRMAAGGE